MLMGVLNCLNCKKVNTLPPPFLSVSKIFIKKCVINPWLPRKMLVQLDWHSHIAYHWKFKKCQGNESPHICPLARLLFLQCSVLHVFSSCLPPDWLESKESFFFKCLPYVHISHVYRCSLVVEKKLQASSGNLYSQCASFIKLAKKIIYSEFTHKSIYTRTLKLLKV